MRQSSLMRLIRLIFLDAKLQNCPYHAYQMLRDDAPVWIDPITGFYVISRFEDMRQVLLDTEKLFQ